MKKVEFIVKEELMDSLKTRLKEAGFAGMTLCSVKDREQAGGVQLEWRAGTYEVEFLHKVMAIMLVPDHDVYTVVDIITSVCKAHDTKIMDGATIIVTDVAQVVRI